MSGEPKSEKGEFVAYAREGERDRWLFQLDGRDLCTVRTLGGATDFGSLEGVAAAIEAYREQRGRYASLSWVATRMG